MPPTRTDPILAARAEGVGSALTSVLGIFHGDQAMEILGVPTGKGWTMACMVWFGYPTGRWGVAPRRPVHEVSYRNSWGNGGRLRDQRATLVAVTGGGAIHPARSDDELWDSGRTAAMAHRMIASNT